MGVLQGQCRSEKARMVFALAHKDGVGADRGANHEQGFRLPADPKPFALAHGEKVCAIVLPNHFPHLRRQREGLRALLQSGIQTTFEDGMVRRDLHNVALLHAQLLLQKIRQPNLPDEAESLAVLFVGRGQFDVRCNGPHLRLFQGTDGEQGMSQLMLIELTQKIALVFVAVCPCQKMVHPIGIGVLSAVMTGGDSFCPKLQRGVQEQVKLHLPVAQHIGVGGSAFAVFVKHVVHDAGLVFCTEVHDLEGNAQVMGDEHGIVGVVDPRTFVVDGDALVVPIAHEKTDHFMTFLLEQMSCNTGVYTP